MDMLASTIAKSSQAAEVIEGSSEQQFVGMDQILQAMRGIEESISAELSCTSGLQSASARLQELGEQLSLHAKRYQI